MTAPGQSGHFDRSPPTSGLPPEANIVTAGRHASNVPNSDVPWSKALKPYSKINVQAELSLYQGFVFLVARSPEINYLLICLARSPVEKRQRIWADRIPQLPTVAFDDLTNLISDNVRRSRLRQ
jgi:hypothetical protein